MESPNNLFSGTGCEQHSSPPEAIPGQGSPPEPDQCRFTEWQMDALDTHNGMAKPIRLDGAVWSKPGTLIEPLAGEQGTRFLIVGGQGHLGKSALQPALAAVLPNGSADCLDRRPHNHSPA